MDATDHHGGWPHLPHDLLAEVAARLLEADPFSVQVLTLVCKPWRRGVKLHLQHLAPTHLPPLAPPVEPWGVTTLHLASSRAKAPAAANSFVLTPQLLQASPEQLSARFPRLASLSLQGQVIPPTHAAHPGAPPPPPSPPTLLSPSLGQAAPLLARLDLSRCTLSLRDLTAALQPSLARLHTLSLAGVLPWPCAADGDLPTPSSAALALRSPASKNFCRRAAAALRRLTAPPPPCQRLADAGFATTCTRVTAEPPTPCPLWLPRGSEREHARELGARAAAPALLRALSALPALRELDLSAELALVDAWRLAAADPRNARGRARYLAWSARHSSEEGAAAAAATATATAALPALMRDAGTPTPLGVPMAGVVTLLSRLPALACLRLRNQRLSPDDYGHVGTALTRLTALELAWAEPFIPCRIAAKQEFAEGEGEGAHGLRVERGSTAGERTRVCEVAWGASVRGLTRLRALGLTIHPPPWGVGTRLLAASQALGLGHLAALTRLHVAGCCAPAMALSIGRLTALEHLGLVHTPPYVFSAELVVQLAAGMPRLTSLDVSYSSCAAHFELPGDVLLRGLARVRPALRELRMAGLPVHGGGFAQGGGGGAAAHGDAPPFAKLERLVLHAGELLMCRFKHLGELTALRSLHLLGMPTPQLVCASKSGGLLALASLAHLTDLQVLHHAPPIHSMPREPIREDFVGGFAPAGAAPVQPGAVVAAAPAGPEAAAAPVPANVQQLLQAAAQVQQAMQGAVAAAQQAGHAELQQAAAQAHAAAQGALAAAQHIAQQVMQQQQQVVAAAEEDQVMLEVGSEAGSFEEEGEDEDGGEEQEQQQLGMAAEAGAGGGGVGGPALAGSDDEDEDMEEEWEEEQEGELGVGGGGGGAAGEPQAAPGVAAGQAGVLAAVASSQARCREPHMHFLSLLPQLQVLVLQGLDTNGMCLAHVAAMPHLRQLALEGSFELNAACVQSMGQVRLPQLESFSITTCHWRASEPTRPATVNAAASSSTAWQRSQEGLAAPQQAAWTAARVLEAFTRALRGVMPLLQHLSLGGCEPMTEAALRMLAAAFPRLKHLSLSSVPPELATADALRRALQLGGGGGDDGAAAGGGAQERRRSEPGAPNGEGAVIARRLQYVRATPHARLELQGGATLVWTDGELAELDEDYAVC